MVEGQVYLLSELMKCALFYLCVGDEHMDFFVWRKSGDDLRESLLGAFQMPSPMFPGYRARKAMFPRAVPTPRACGSRGRLEKRGEGGWHGVRRRTR